MVYRDRDVRNIVALQKCMASSVDEAVADPKKAEVYYRWMDEVPMVGRVDEQGKYEKGVEDAFPRSQYETDEYQDAVVEDIVSNWIVMSRNRKFHAIFATSSIPEAIRYYRKFREKAPDLRATGLFDPSIDNVNAERSLAKEDGLKEMLQDYNMMFDQNFSIGS